MTKKPITKEAVVNMADATGLSTVQVRKLMASKAKPHNKLLRAAWDAALKVST